VTERCGGRKPGARHDRSVVRVAEGGIMLWRKPAAGSLPPMSPHLSAIVLLLCSNVFMTFAWYAHLKNLADKPWLVAALLSWGVALFEYLFQVPANRIGHEVMTVGQLKILQEIITLLVFVPFSLFYLRERLTLDYLWAGLCILGAVFFMFRARLGL
jgi:uncharacterized protein (DUF486 family)